MELTPLEPFIQQSLMRLGRNLLAFQRVEACLKLFSPYLIPKDDVTPAIPPLNVSDLLARKITLGPLIELLKAANKLEDGSTFERDLNRLLTHRNELIHHFLEREDAALNSEERCISAISYLDEQYSSILPMHDLIVRMTKAFAIGLNASEYPEDVTNLKVSGKT